jgi:hypothetical protein
VNQAASDGAAGFATTDILFDSGGTSQSHLLLEARAAYVPVAQEQFFIQCEGFVYP